MTATPAPALSNTALIDMLNARLEAALAPYLSDAPFALVDFPDHANVGDSAIWLGETAFFARHGKRPHYCSSLKTHDHDAMRKAIGTGPIFLHGGGNFGTLWQAHQDFRIALMERFPDNQIIQLPQSIHFESDAAADATVAAIARHGGFTLFVRDTPSQAFAEQRLGCATILAPDMAFCMGVQPRGAPAHDIFCLMRTDHEKSVTGALPASSHAVAAGDWLTEDRARIRRARVVSRLLGLADADGAALRTFDRLAQMRVQRGLDQLSSGRVVITDRLHGHILSTLAGIPNVTLDNSYRKLGNFIDAWTAPSPIHRPATTLDGAMAAAEALLTEEIAA